MWFFSKTCRVLEHSMLVSTLDDYSGPLPHWGMMHSGGITALKTLARPTFVIGGSAWPSPSATDTRVRAAPSHPHLTKNGTLRHINKAGTQSAIRLSQAVKFFDGGVGELNPDWVETLMGYPPDWTDISGPPAPARRSSIGNRRARPRASKIGRTGSRRWATPSSRKLSSRLRPPLWSGLIRSRKQVRRKK